MVPERASILKGKRPLTLDEQVSAAVEKARKVQADIDSGKIGEIEGAVKLKSLNKAKDLQTRLNALFDWATEEVGAQGPQFVYAKMLNYLNNTLNVNSGFISSGNESTGERITSLMGRKLSENIEQDRRLQTFLGLENDPVKILLNKLEQQNKIRNNIEQTTRIAEVIVRSGLGVPEGSSVSPETYSDTKVRVFPNVGAGILNNINIDPNIAPFIEQELKLNTALTKHSMSGWAKATRLVKFGQTVSSPRLITSNYTSNFGVLAFNGSLLYLLSKNPETGASFGADMIRGVKERLVK